MKEHSKTHTQKINIAGTVAQVLKGRWDDQIPVPSQTSF